MAHGLDVCYTYPPLIWTTTRVVALDLALGPCHDATIPWALVGRALGPLMALVGPPAPLWAGPLWAPWALVGPPGPLWAGPPLWAPPGPYGPGPYGPPWALMGRPLWALLGPYGPGPCGLPWALMGLALMGPLGPGP